MPEGDTVYRTARLLNEALAGSPVTATDFRVPQWATFDLSGATLTETVPRGKHLLTRFEHAELGAWSLHTHLKMEGTWRVYRPGQRWQRPAFQARVVLTTARAVAVGFALGTVDLLPADREQEAVGHLGPDLLGPDWDAAEAERRLRAQPGRGIAEALLDQTCLAGIGNVYACELCFLAGIDPTTPVGEVADLPRLLHRAHTMLEANKDRVSRVTTGNQRQGERVWVHRRDRQPCRRCGTPIRVAMLGAPGQERATYWCPACQPRR